MSTSLIVGITVGTILLPVYWIVLAIWTNKVEKHRKEELKH